MKTKTAEALFVELCRIGDIERGANMEAERKAVDLIASAIRSAENEALERAAKELAMYADEASGHTEEEWAFEKAVEVVRALKSKEP